MELKKKKSKELNKNTKNYLNKIKNLINTPSKITNKNRIKGSIIIKRRVFECNNEELEENVNLLEIADSIEAVCFTIVSSNNQYIDLITLINNDHNKTCKLLSLWKIDNKGGLIRPSKIDILNRIRTDYLGDTNITWNKIKNSPTSALKTIETLYLTPIKTEKEDKREKEDELSEEEKEEFEKKEKREKEKLRINKKRLIKIEELLKNSIYKDNKSVLEEKEQLLRIIAKTSILPRIPTILGDISNWIINRDVMDGFIANLKNQGATYEEIQDKLVIFNRINKDKIMLNNLTYSQLSNLSKNIYKQPDIVSELDRGDSHEKSNKIPIQMCKGLGTQVFYLEKRNDFLIGGNLPMM